MGDRTIPYLTQQRQQQMTELKNTTDAPECPCCQKHILSPYAWLPDMGGHYKDNNYYECANCGPLPKDAINLIIQRLERSST